MNERVVAKRLGSAAAEWRDVSAGWHRWMPVVSQWMASSTARMLALAGISRGMRVLDVCAGDGDQSLQAARLVGPEGSVLATDISSELLTWAEADARAAGLHNVETRVMPGEELDASDATFDAVICRYGLMLMADVRAALREIHRVLRPGGRVGVAVFSRPEENPWLAIPASIAMEHAGTAPPKPGEPGIFSLGGEGAVEALFREADFCEVHSEKSELVVELSSAEECICLVRDMAGDIHGILSSVSGEVREQAWETMHAGLTRFERDGVFRSPCAAVVGGARKAK